MAKQYEQIIKELIEDYTKKGMGFHPFNSKEHKYHTIRKRYAKNNGHVYDVIMNIPHKEFFEHYQKHIDDMHSVEYIDPSTIGIEDKVYEPTKILVPDSSIFLFDISTIEYKNTLEPIIREDVIDVGYWPYIFRYTIEHSNDFSLIEIIDHILSHTVGNREKYSVLATELKIIITKYKEYLKYHEVSNFIDSYIPTYREIDDVVLNGHYIKELLDAIKRMHVHTKYKFESTDNMLLYIKEAIKDEYLRSLFATSIGIEERKGRFIMMMLIDTMEIKDFSVFWKNRRNKYHLHKLIEKTRTRM